MLRKNKIFLTLLLTIGIVALIFMNSLTLSEEVILTKFVLGENMGFDLSPRKLNFGQIVPGHSASREIMIENNFDETIKVLIKSSGEISQYMIVSENNFLLPPSESKNVTFSAYADNKLTEFRSYEGKVIIISKKV